MQKRFFRGFRPWYDDSADFNTNAKSYYDYLARHNKFLKWVESCINRLLKRDVEIKDTVTIDLTKTGNWQDNCECTNADCTECGCICYDDVITLSADVIFSKQYTENLNSYFTGTTIQVINGSKQVSDGLWSPNYDAFLNYEFSWIRNKFSALDTEISNIKTDITNMKADILNLQTDVASIKNEIANIKTDIINMKTDISNLRSDLTALTNTVTANHTLVTSAIQKILDNLYSSGAINSTDIETYGFNNNRVIANGNINLFGATDQGNYFIRTNTGATENDVIVGVGT